MKLVVTPFDLSRLKCLYLLIISFCLSSISSNVYGQNWEHLVKLHASDASSDASLGQEVSISGDWAVVGAPWESSLAQYAGCAYIYKLTAGVWTEFQKIQASDAGASDNFGRTISISGDYILVGAPTHGSPFPQAGAVYAFAFNGTQWIETQKITAYDAALSDFFGFSIDISGNRAIISSVFDDDLGNNSGSAYFYELIGGTWNLINKVTAIDGSADQFFGYSVTMSGNFAAVGVQDDDQFGTNSGSLYIYQWDGTYWNETQKITSNDVAAGDRFGFPVSMDGNWLISGARADDDNGASSGSTYVFELNNSVWSEYQKITPSDGDSLDNFGFSGSINGDQFIVSATGNDDGGYNTGSVYVFELNNGTWGEVQKLVADVPQNQENFGSSIAILNDKVVIGAQSNDAAFQNAGAVNFYGRPTTSSITATECGSYTSPSGQVYTTSQVVTDTVYNASGADSIITIAITILPPIDLSGTLVGSTLTSNQQVGTFQWIDCNNGNTHIPGETGNSFTPTMDGSYAVIITNGPCTDTTGCTEVLNVGLDEGDDINYASSIYPNPTTGSFTVKLHENTDCNFISIVNTQGKVLKSIDVKKQHEQLMEFHIDHPAGLYFVRVQSSYGTETIPLIKK